MSDVLDKGLKVGILPAGLQANPRFLEIALGVALVLYRLLGSTCIPNSVKRLFTLPGECELSDVDLEYEHVETMCPTSNALP